MILFKPKLYRKSVRGSFLALKPETLGPSRLIGLFRADYSPSKQEGYWEDCQWKMWPPARVTLGGHRNQGSMLGPTYRRVGHTKICLCLDKNKLSIPCCLRGGGGTCTPGSLVYRRVKPGQQCGTFWKPLLGCVWIQGTLVN